MFSSYFYDNDMYDNIAVCLLTTELILKIVFIMKDWISIRRLCNFVYVLQSPIQSPSPVMCQSPEYLYSPYAGEYLGVPLEPPGPIAIDDEPEDEGPSTAEIIASQSQDYVDEKLAEYQATIQQLQGKWTTSKVKFCVLVVMLTISCTQN